MTNSSSALVSRLWRLCSLLRKDGVTYPQYVTELSYLIFLKLASELAGDTLDIPSGYDWQSLLAQPDELLLDRYRATLSLLGKSKKSRAMQAVFSGAHTVVRESSTLRRLIEAIDESGWHSDERDTFGDAYEGLLQKNAEETKKGAGQYFTPRSLVNAIVETLDPKPGEIIQDPAAGTGGFLIAANRAIKDKYSSLSSSKQRFQSKLALRGVENVHDTYRLLCMNLYLHNIEADHIFMGDTLSHLGEDGSLKNADVILSNPPFGPSGSTPTRTDLPITNKSTNFQLPFVEHCMNALAPGGRAAVIVPDNILFEGGRGRELRRELMRNFELHTILRLPTRIFYAQGVRTNVLFFSRPLTQPNIDATKDVWFYDLRSQSDSALNSAAFENGLREFVTAYGTDPNGGSARIDGTDNGKFRCFSREYIAERDDDLYIAWLSDDENSENELELAAPDIVAEVVERHLISALSEIRALMSELCEDGLTTDEEP